MVGHHITERSCHIKIAATLFHAHSFRHRDLNVVNIATVPNGLKNSIAETEDQDILHRLLAKVMVDAENLTFAQDLAHLAVQGFGRSQLIAEGLLKHHAPPVSIS